MSLITNLKIDADKNIYTISIWADKDTELARVSKDFPKSSPTDPFSSHMHMIATAFALVAKLEREGYLISDNFYPQDLWGIEVFV